ncbi:MAG: hypothetical protein WEC37_04785 [Anaerolineales bacterium]
MASPNVFIPGLPAPPTPLERYLPPMPAGVIAVWLATNVAKGAWVLDPFGASPLLAVEAARAGYRVAVAANNPVARFLLEMYAQPPSAEELTAALALLSAAKGAEDRLEPVILELYETECPKCNAQTPADAFIWQADAEAPSAKIVNCKACGEQGEYPTDDKDKERAASFQRGGPHLSRALERIAPKGDPDREHAEEALEAYLPRAVYALFTIINRVDGVALDDAQRKLVSALVLSACDRATKLWAHPSGRLRPKQLSVPAQFREYNLWYEMERSIELWAEPQKQVPMMAWPDAPPESGGISLFEGRLREMSPELGKFAIQAVITAFPRPNQAFWTLCALWAGWLWGREAIGPFALVLRRRRYDWAWHTEALHAGFSTLSEEFAENTPLFGIVTESESGFNSAAMVAANLADFRIEGMAHRREEALLQLTWRQGIPISAEKKSDAAKIVSEAVQQILLARGEPSHFLHLQAAALAQLAQTDQMGREQSQPGELHAEVKSELETGLTFRRRFLRFGGSEQSLETGLWWLSDTAVARSPLADRVEIATVRYLIRHPDESLADIDRALCKVFPGLLTPPLSLVQAMLQSYGEEQDGKWRISTGDVPRDRREDLRVIRAALVDLGKRLGYQASGDVPLQWQDKQGVAVLNFYLIASAVLGEILLKADTQATKNLIVLPGRRAPLALYKIERDPRLAQAVADGWRFVKFRHVRRLAENRSLTPDSFTELLDLDPLTLENLQAPLL